MNSSPSDTTERLKQMVRDELEERDDVDGFEIEEDEAAGVKVTVSEPDRTAVYHVTLETRLDGTEETHWSFLGEGV